MGLEVTGLITTGRDESHHIDASLDSSRKTSHQGGFIWVWGGGDGPGNGRVYGSLWVGGMPNRADSTAGPGAGTSNPSLAKVQAARMIPTVHRFWVMLSLILAAFWVPATSHAFLASLGVIQKRHSAHVEAHYHGLGESHGHDGDNHDFADGICRTEASRVRVPSVSRSCLHAAFLTAGEGLADTSINGLDWTGPSPPGAPPPEVSRVWQFSLQAALPVRAPPSLL